MHVFPTRDVHLVLAAGLNREIHLSLFEDRQGPPPLAKVWTDLSTVPTIVIDAVPIRVLPSGAFTFRGRSIPLAANDSPTGFSIAPAVAGTGFLAVRVLDGAARHFPVRVTVHSDITRIWFAQTTLTMLSGESNAVLTVFGQFPDPGGINHWDISEHPYLEYSSDQPAVATVDPATGRVTAVARGDATIHVRIAGRPASDQTCTVRVETIAALRTSGDIQVRTLHAARGATHRFFILSEGYTDPTVFGRQAQEVVDKWLHGEANTPFRWVRDKLRVISIFDRAPARGISVGPVIALLTDGSAIPQTQDTFANVLGTTPYLPPRDTRFGLMYGARLGDPEAAEVGIGFFGQIGNEWVRPGGAYSPPTPHPGAPVRADRSITVDHRKLPEYRNGTTPPIIVTDPRTAFAGFLRRYLSHLGFSATDEDWIVFLIDDQFRGGSRLPIIGLEFRDNRRVAMTTASDENGFDNFALVPGTPWIDRTPQRRTFHAGWVASSVVHEIGHTFGLGDEYEHQRNTVAATAENRTVLLGYDNLQLRDDVFDIFGQLRADRIKWNAAARVLKASRISLVSRAPTIPVFYDLVLDGKPRRTWKSGEVAYVRTTYARPPDDPDPQVPRLRVHQVTINDVTDTGVSIHVVSGPIDADEFGTHGVLYVPRTTHTGIPITLIEPAVMEHLHATDSVFPKPSPCNSNATDVAEEEVRPPAIPNLKMPSRPADLIGLYEGGSDHACGIVRPAGRCKLRRAAVYDSATGSVGEIWPFCFVCRYVIVDHIDPGVHAKLDDEYPRDC